MDNITYQRDLWKMVAAMDYVTVGKENVTVQPQRGVVSGSGNSWNVSVPHVYLNLMPCYWVILILA